MWYNPGLHNTALIAQLAEHALSKRKVTSSNLVGGCSPVRVGVVGNISACHADAPGSIPGHGDKLEHFLFYFFRNGTDGVSVFAQNFPRRQWAAWAPCPAPVVQ